MRRFSNLLLLSAIVIGLGAATAGHAAGKIYRTVDKDGNVVFTDVPPKDGENGAAVDLNQSNDFTPPPVAGPGASVETWLGGEGSDESAEDKAPPPVRYQVAVASPGDDEAVRANDGNVLITASIQPQLQGGHAVQLFIDGALHQQSDEAVSFQLTSMDRGTHQAEFRVVDGRGNTLASSGTSTFHVLRHSILQPSARRP